MKRSSSYRALNRPSVHLASPEKDRLIALVPAYLFGQQLSFLKDRDRRRMMPVVSNLSSHRERHDILVVWQIENHCQLACRGHFDDQLFMDWVDRS